MAERRSRKICWRERKRWSFGDCLFDEGEWRLFVRGTQVAVETKPLELLRELLARADHVVDKEELLDRVWPDVTVVEASLPTAIRKLRRAFGEADADPSMIETVPGVGYRFRGPVLCEGEAAPGASRAAPEVPRSSFGRKMVLAGVTTVLAVATIAWTNRPSPPLAPNFSPAQRVQLSAMRQLDVPKLEQLISSGWDVTTPYDREGNDALMWLLNVCEWDPQHDRRQMLLAARTLVDADHDFFHRNIFGDTVYSIARAKRFCGPDHPVTVMLRRMCVNSDGGGGDRCMATYELAKGVHFPG